MALSAPRINFGIHSIAPYARATKTIGDTTFYKGQPFGLFQVLGDASFSLPATSIPLFGGSSLHAWTSELVQIASEIVFNVKESPDMLYSVFAGADVALTAASATGTIVALVNVEGTSVQSATTGITTATIKSGSETDLKFNKYVVVAKSTTTVDVYAMTDLQFANATALTYQDDALKITASPLTIETDTAVEVPNTGVELTGGSGTIALVANDTAVYHTTAAHGGISTIDIGKKGINFPEHGLLMYGKERSDGTLFQLEIYKARVSAGIVLPMSEGDFQITDVTVRALIDSAPIDGSGVAKVATMKAVAPV
jgi:hypothetical protein